LVEGAAKSHPSVFDFVRDLLDKTHDHSPVLALAVSTWLAPSKLPNICFSLPLGSNHASVLHSYALRSGMVTRRHNPGTNCVFIRQKCAINVAEET
jgi:hypothetical protein